MVINQFLNVMILPLPGCLAGTLYLQGGPKKPVIAGGTLGKGWLTSHYMSEGFG